MKSPAPKKPLADADSPPKTAANVSGLDGVKRSADLFGSRRELLIEHAGCIYRLRITQHNKLILTK